MRFPPGVNARRWFGRLSAAKPSETVPHFPPTESPYSASDCRDRSRGLTQYRCDKDAIPELPPITATENGMDRGRRIFVDRLATGWVGRPASGIRLSMRHPDGGSGRMRSAPGSNLRRLFESGREKLRGVLGYERTLRCEHPCRLRRPRVRTLKKQSTCVGADCAADWRGARARHQFAPHPPGAVSAPR